MERNHTVCSWNRRWTPKWKKVESLGKHTAHQPEKPAFLDKLHFRKAENARISACSFGMLTRLHVNNKPYTACVDSFSKRSRAMVSAGRSDQKK